jgi:hypothetical protein
MPMFISRGPHPRNLSFMSGVGIILHVRAQACLSLLWSGFDRKWFVVFIP